jgi:hypothetical protein
MRTVWTTVFVATFCAATAYGQTELTEQQRIADLNQLASLYAKNYAPYEWKRDVLGFDLLRLNSWMQQIHKQTDLDFQETLIDYVASLNDAHSFITFPSNFSVSLPLTLDIYDGKVLIDSINRTLLPATQFPFGIGDELIAFDGSAVWDAIASLRKYFILANQRSTDRFAAGGLTGRPQQYQPHAADVPDSALLTIRLAATGVTSTYTVPWIKRGIPIASDGPVPSPGRQPFRETEEIPGTSSGPGQGRPPSVIRTATASVDDTLPPYMASIAPLLNASLPMDQVGVLNLWNSKFPFYGPPPGFVQRRGAASADFFLTGTFPANGLRIGLLRIPHMAPTSVSTALQQLDSELAYFNANTDGLVVDLTRNGGGSISFMESMLQRFFPAPFQTIGFEIRANQNWFSGFAESLTAAKLANAPAQIVQNLQNEFDEVERAFHQQRGRTIPLSLNFTGSLTLNPSSNAYRKPLLVLVDELTISAGEMMATVIQDNGRAPIFGMRTVGGGGSVVGFNATSYTESTAYVTISLANRGRVIQTPDFPPTPYLENVGVRPDVVYDYMTRANLMAAGSPYVQAFTNAIVNLIQHTVP